MNRWQFAVAMVGAMILGELLNAKPIETLTYLNTLFLILMQEDKEVTP